MSDETTNEPMNEEVADVAARAPVDAVVEAPVDVPVEAPAETKVEKKVETKVAAEPAVTVEETDDSRTNPRKVREGVVVSDKMDSTLVVAVNERVRHARYGKTVQRTKKLYVHDEKSEAKVGDKVRVQETRPLSKLKRWRLTEIVERAR